MKKRLLLAGMLFMASSLFGLEKSFTSMGVNFSVPLLVENGSEEGVKVETTMNSIGLGFQELVLSPNKWGYFWSLDFIFPQTLTIKASYGGYSSTISANREDYDSIWGFSYFFAPAYSIINNGKVVWDVAPGLNMIMYFANAAKSACSLMFGLGVDTQVQFMFGEHGYIDLGLCVAFDFLGFVSVDGESKSGTTNDFLVAPKIGVGYKF